MSETKQSLKNRLITNSLLCAFILLAPIAAFFGLFIPEGETHATWFQRSGSLMVGLAVLVELRVISSQEFFDPLNAKYSIPIELPRAYHLWYGVLVSANTIMVILGTLLWGYGDLFL